MSLTAEPKIYIIPSTARLEILTAIIKALLPTDAQKNCFKRGIKIYIKTVPTCFDVITIIRERTI